MRRTGLMLLVVTLMTCVPLKACGGGANQCSDSWWVCVTYDPGEPIRLATALNATGINEDIGNTARRGVELALHERGQVLGHTVKLQVVDGSCYASGGKAIADPLVSDKSLAVVIGHGCSEAREVAAAGYSEAGILTVSPSCSSPSLTGQNRARTFFRTCPNAALRGELAARFFADELSLHSVAVIHDENDPALQGSSAFGQAFEALGGTQVTNQVFDESALVTAAGAWPDLLFSQVSVADGAQALHQARSTPGLSQAFLVACSLSDTARLISEGGEASGGVFLVASSGNGNRFDALYEARFGHKPAWQAAVYAYDAP